MHSVENIFDINRMLKNSFFSLEQLIKDKKIELIFEMHPTLPRELRGNEAVLEQLLTKVLTFVFTYTKQREIVLVINAPEDFLYEELISFQIAHVGIVKEKVLAFLETELGNNLNILDGKILYDENDIHLNIPFTIGELGFRRHYRLPSKAMLQKKVLLIVESENVTTCITKMFKYFPYDIDFGFKSFQSEKTDLSEYDVVIIEDNLITELFKIAMKKVQAKQELKFVLLGGHALKESENVCACLVKPLTQESIFELIISLFDEKSKKVKSKKTIETLTRVPLQQLQTDSDDSTLQGIIESKRSEPVDVLNTVQGLKNTQAMDMSYVAELEKFLEIFDRSDLYFRQIVNEKAENKIKEFCIDLEKQSKVIGAESMLKFADIVSLIFVYNKLDILPIYPGRYHIELDKLVTAIKKYLHIQ